MDTVKLNGSGNVISYPFSSTISRCMVCIACISSLTAKSDDSMEVCYVNSSGDCETLVSRRILDLLPSALYVLVSIWVST